MTLFNPSEAPRLHIELLPSNTKAVGIQISEYHQRYNHHPLCYYITVWAPRSAPLACRDKFDDELFLEEHCYECQWHTESLEVDVDDQYSSYDGYEVTLHGYASAYSPCPCYSDGLGEVSWPCLEGHDGPEDEEYQIDSDETINASFLSYGIIIDTTTYSKVGDFAQQQGCLIEDGNVYVTERYRAANTFEGSPYRICWGESLTPNNLQTIEQTFTTTFANEDLLSFSAHNDFAVSIQDEIDEFTESADGSVVSDMFMHLPNALPFTYEGAPMGIAIASVSTNLEAFMLMAASGAHIRDGFAMARVAQFTNVAVTEDFIATVWVSEELKAGVRLMYLDHPQDGHILLGQIPLNFDLSCKSIKPQSSDAEELVNS